MPGIMDFLMGSGPLKKAAGAADKSSSSSTPAPGYAQSDIAKMAQDSADRQLKKPSSLSTPMTPVTKKAPPQAKGK